MPKNRRIRLSSRSWQAIVQNPLTASAVPIADADMPKPLAMSRGGGGGGDGGGRGQTHLFLSYRKSKEPALHAPDTKLG